MVTGDAVTAGVARNAIYRSCILETHTWILYDLINHVTPKDLMGEVRLLKYDKKT